MNDLTKLAAKQHLTQELTKVAAKNKKLSGSDRRRAEALLNREKHINRAIQILDQERAKSFSLKHPILTGVPTLGWAPVIASHLAAKRAHEKAKEEKLPITIQYR